MLPLLSIWLGTVYAQGPELDISGRVQSDLMYRLEEQSVGNWVREASVPEGFSRNDNLLNIRMRSRMGKMRGVSDLDFVLLGMAEPAGYDEIGSLAQLSFREQVDPYRVDVHSLYLERRDLGLNGLDLRVGQQLVQWGAGDQFNPTNNLNSEDMEHPLRFGDQLGNIMARVDYSPRGNATLTGVVVPILG